MATKLYLIEKIDGLGEIGDIATVADGYARNFLIPKGKAVLAEGKKSGDTGILRQIERRKKIAEEQLAREVAEAETRASELNKVKITIPVKVNDDGKLFGSVNAQQIVSSLKEIGVEIDRRIVAVNKGLHELGTHSVEIHLHAQVTATIQVNVVKMEV